MYQCLTRFGCLQILRTGFFHADPHPGNLAVDADGSLIYYDFGMMGEIKSFTREKLLEMFYAVYEKDAQKIIQALIELGALVPTGDMGSVSFYSIISLLSLFVLLYYFNLVLNTEGRALRRCI